MTAVYLWDPPAPGPAWVPFAGVRPVAELVAGAWSIRRRWELVLAAPAAGILASHAAGFHEDGCPPVTAERAIPGPAIVVSSTFAPMVAPLAPPAGIRRLTAGGESVGWILAAGETWSGPHDEGPSAEIEGIHLGGAYQLLDTLDAMLARDSESLMEEPAILPTGAIVLGDPGRVVAREAEVEPGVVFDVRHGPVVVEVGASVRHGSRLEGPLVVGRGTVVLGGFLRRSVFGPQCRVRGEVSHAIFAGYANKAHDGFVGHSVLGRWVNLGAMTTTSNLKNTYGEVALLVGGRRIKTGRQLLGSLIGDHAKTAIGTLLATGTVVGAGANVFGPDAVPKEVPPFAWGNDGTERMHRDGFLAVAERVLPRRGVAWSAAYAASLGAMYDRVAGL